MDEGFKWSHTASDTCIGPSSLLKIASSMGMFLEVVIWARNYTFGHYARLLVSRESFAFNVEVVYELFPNFCSHYQIIIHLVSTCRWLYP
jgi:hypothetical protein